MKNIFLFAVAALFLGACATGYKVAEITNQKDYNDDVYFSDVSAREEIAIARAVSKPTEKTYRTEEELYGGNNYGDYPYNRDSYSDRIRRFYYYDSPFFNNSFYSLNPWSNNYGVHDYGYNNYGFNNYGFNNFGFNSYSFNNFNNWFSPGLNLYIGVNPWKSTYNAPFWMYGYPYSNRYWGPVSYNNYYPGYGGYGGNGGRFINPRPTVQDPNYRPRPMRSAENIGGVPIMGTIRTDSQGRTMTSTSRGEANERTNSTGSNGRISNTPPAEERVRPARAEQVRPAIERETPSRTSIQSEPRQSFPSGGGGGSGNTGGGSESRERPSRLGN
jgi:hypothetical protein